MTLLNWNPVHDLITMSETMDRLMDSTLREFNGGPLGNDAVRGHLTNWAMPIDAYMTDDAVVIEANVAGIKPDDLKITLEGNTLTLRGEIKADKVEKKARKDLLRERTVGKFESTLTINTPIDQDHVTADFENGILTLTLPKTPESKPRQIEIKPKMQITAHSHN